MYSTLDSVKISLQRAQDTQKAYADLKRKAYKFTFGDKVLLSIKNFRFPAGKRKLQGIYFGPFGIVDMIGPNAAKLKLDCKACIG